MTYPIRSIALGLAELDAGDSVLRYGLDLARRLGARLHVVHAFLPPEAALGLGAVDPMGLALPTLTVDPGLGPDLRKTLAARLQALLPPAEAGAETVPHLVAGTPGDALSESARTLGADLILIGAAQAGRLEQVLLGSTTAHVVRHAQVPVLVLRKPPRPPGTRVLLTTDLSEPSARAVEVGAAVAHTLCGGSAEYRLLCSLPPGAGDAAAAEEQPARETLRALARRLAASGAPVAEVLRAGAPADEILAEAAAWPAELVVLGTHSRSGLSRLLLGSVAETALRELRCSALVVPSVLAEAEQLAA